MHIYVSIASYRDPLLPYTIRDLMENRSSEHDVTYAVFEQSYKEESLGEHYPELAFHPDVIYKRIDPEYSDGVVWARHINSIGIRDEHDFFYQVDSHMLFDPDWDKMVISDFEKASKLAGHDKIIITGSCKIFDYDPETKISTKREVTHTTSVKYYKFRLPGYVPAAHGDVATVTEYPERGFHILAGNFFTNAKWVRDVGLDPQLYYETEEVMMSLTSWVNGYAIFHNCETPCYHLFETENWHTKPHINPVVDLNKIYEHNDRSIKLFEEYLEFMGEELLVKYHKEFGVDYINKKIEERARTYSHPNDTEYDCTAAVSKPSVI